MSMHDRWFLVIHRWRHLFLRERFGGLDVEPRLLPLLCRLYAGHGSRQEDLSVESGLDKTTIAHAVKRLAELGYVSRERCLDDRRSYRLTLTEKAKALVPEIVHAMDEWESGLTSDFTPDELQALDDCLRRMAANAEAHSHPSTSVGSGG